MIAVESSPPTTVFVARQNVVADIGIEAGRPIANETFIFVFEFPISELIQVAMLHNLADVVLINSRLTEPTISLADVINEFRR